MPIGAFGGRREIMELLAPIGPVYQAGTLSGNPIATAAGAAVLSILNEESYEALERRAERLASGLTKAFSEAGIEAQVQRFSTLIGIFFGKEGVNNYLEAKASVSLDLYPGFFAGMLSRGIAFAPGPYEAVFVGLSHSTEDIDRTVEAAAEVAGQMAK